MAKNSIFESKFPASRKSCGHKFGTGGKVLPRRSDGMSFSKIVRAVFEKNAKNRKSAKKTSNLPFLGPCPGPPRDTSVINLVSPNAQLSLEGTCKVWSKSYGQFSRNHQKGCFCGKKNKNTSPIVLSKIFSFPLKIFSIFFSTEKNILSAVSTHMAIYYVIFDR